MIRGCDGAGQSTMTIVGFLRELRRRNVPRACFGYVATVWALAQGIAQLTPEVGAPDWTTRGFLIATAIGFPFWVAFSWFYELTPEGIKLDSEVVSNQSDLRATRRKLDVWIIGALVVAVVLLLTDRVVRHEATKPVIAEESIAVLPLINDSEDIKAVYFSDGLSEAFITALSQFPGLRVIARASSFQFRNSKDAVSAIGEKLGVAHLLEGSVQHVGDTVRITTELVNARDGTTLWSQHYDRPYADLFQLQDDITNAVATALKARLFGGQTVAARSGRPPSGSLEAYNQYLLARYYVNSHVNEAAVRKAIDALNLAVRIDPRYATAWGGLAIAWTNLAGGYLSGAQAQDAYAQARVAANKAMTLGPDLANTHLARGTVLENADSDLVGAEAEYRRAVQLTPNDDAPKFDLSSVLAKLGRIREATQLANEALVLDPLNGTTYYQLSSFHLPLGRLDDAQRTIRKALALQPDGISFNEQAAVVEILRGDADAALRAAQQESPGPWQDVGVTLARQVGKDSAAADAALKNLIAKDGDQAPFQIAEVFALRKDPNKTFEWLDRAWSSHDGGVELLLYDPFILYYRSDPRFAPYCRKVGLPPTTDATIGPVTP